MILFINKVQSALFLIAAPAFMQVELHLKWCLFSPVAFFGDCKVSWGIDSTMIGMCLDGYTLEEVDLMDKGFFSTFSHITAQELTGYSFSVFHIRQTALDGEEAVTVLLKV